MSAEPLLPPLPEPFDSITCINCAATYPEDPVKEIDVYTAVQMHAYARSAQAAAQTELAAALGWPGGISAEPAGWVDMLQAVCKLRVSAAQAAAQGMTEEVRFAVGWLKAYCNGTPDPFLSMATAEIRTLLDWLRSQNLIAKE